MTKDNKRPQKCLRCKETANLKKGYYEAGFEEGPSFDPIKSPQDEDGTYFEWFCQEHYDEEVSDTAF